MGRSKMVMQDQVKMDGIDTVLSTAADRYLEAQSEVIRAKSTLGEVEQEFIEAMKDHSKTTITHDGRTFSVRRGHVVKETIVVK